MTAERSSHELDDDIEAYALGTLSEEAAAAFEARLAASAELREEVWRARAVTWLLGESAPPAEPSPALKERIMAAVRADQAGHAAPAAHSPVPAAEPIVATVPPTPLHRLDRPASRPGWPHWLAAAAVLVAIGLGAWSAMLQQRLDQQQGRLAEQTAQLNQQASIIEQQQAEITRDRAALQTLAAADRVWRMQGEPLYAPQATSMLAVNQEQKQTVLVVQGFPPLPEGQVYQVWVIVNGQPVPVDTFAPPSLESEQTLVVPSDLTGVTHAAITVEPGPTGSQQPTGAVVMGGDL